MKLLSTRLRVLLPVVSCGALLWLSGIPTSGAEHHDQMHAVLWMQRSAEYKACCLQVYNQASQQLNHALRDPAWTACLEQTPESNFGKLPPAIVVDVDETVLDNGGFNARMIQDRTGFESLAWAKWCAEQRATPVPGSLEFLSAAWARGIRVIYITNRKVGAEETATRANLRRLGYPLVEGEGEDLVLTKGEIGDKAARRRHVCQRYRVLALFGDNIGDFTVPVKPRQGQAHGEVVEAVRTEKLRHAGVVTRASYWGTRWFMLPNPAYGSWESVMLGQSKDKASLLRTQRASTKPGGKTGR